MRHQQLLHLADVGGGKMELVERPPNSVTSYPWTTTSALELVEMYHDPNPQRDPCLSVVMQGEGIITPVAIITTATERSVYKEYREVVLPKKLPGSTVCHTLSGATGTGSYGVGNYKVKVVACNDLTVNTTYYEVVFGHPNVWKCIWSEGAGPIRFLLELSEVELGLELLQGA